MVTIDYLVQLVKNQGQEAVAAAVVKIPDEDVRPAVMLMVMIYEKSDEINRELFRRDQKRIAELEEELEKARAELHQLKQEPVSYTHLDVYKRQVLELNEIKQQQSLLAATKASKYNPEDIHINFFGGMEIISSKGKMCIRDSLDSCERGVSQH